MSASSSSENMSFVDVTTPKNIAKDLYQGQIESSWYQGRGSFGGLLTGFAIRAFSASVADATRRVRSLHMHFCAPLTDAPFEFRVVPVRTGGRVSHLQGQFIQNDEVMAIASSTFAAPRQDDLKVDNYKPPSALPPADAMVIPEDAPTPVFLQHFDMRVALGEIPFSGAKRANLGGYIRLKDAPPPSDDDSIRDATLSACADAWPPAAFAVLDKPRNGASVDLTFTFLHPTHSYPPDALYLVEIESGFIDDGYAPETAMLYAPDGKAVLHARQLVALF